METSPAFRSRRLPHVDQAGSVHFITWRLKPGLPELSAAERELVAGAIKHFRGTRYRLFVWVVMNDHVHVLFQPRTGHNKSSVLHSWKSFSSNQMQRLHGRAGAIWQPDCHDHLIRNEADMMEKWQYILDNPRKRWPGDSDYAWVSAVEDADGFD